MPCSQSLSTRYFLTKLTLCKSFLRCRSVLAVCRAGWRAQESMPLGGNLEPPCSYQMIDIPASLPLGWDNSEAYPRCLQHSLSPVLHHGHLPSMYCVLASSFPIYSRYFQTTCPQVLVLETVLEEPNLKQVFIFCTNHFYIIGIRDMKSKQISS